MKPAKTSNMMYGDDVRPGYRADLGSHVVTTEEIVAFATDWDPQFFHLDAQRAITEGHFGGLIASGLHTMSISQRLAVDGCLKNWHVIGGAGIQDVQFRLPVRPGDTLTGVLLVEDVQHQPERERTLVDYSGQLTNHHGDPVLTLAVSAFLRMRAA